MFKWIKTQVAEYKQRRTAQLEFELVMLRNRENTFSTSPILKKDIEAVKKKLEKLKR